MTAEKIRNILKTEYGIANDEEFEAAIKEYSGVDIGILVMPLPERSESEEQKLAVCF